MIVVTARAGDAKPGQSAGVSETSLDGDNPTSGRGSQLVRDLTYPPLFTPPETSFIRRSEGLLIACRELSTAGNTAALLEAIPRLGAGICEARGGQLLELDAGGIATILATHGAPLMAAAEEPAAVPVGALVTISIPRAAGLRLQLVLEMVPGAHLQPVELGQLEIFAFMSATALARAALNLELQASQSIETALVGAVHDAVIALDVNGVIRSLSGSAAMLIGQRGKVAIGKRLRDLAGLEPLALALSSGDRCPETVQLACGRVKLRLRRCDGGLAVTLVADSDSAARRAGEQYVIGGAHHVIADLLGDSPLIRRARETAKRMADLDVPILITGETGTGKEILAQAIHTASARAGEPFVGVNVSAIPRELLESELFGYEPGAFTGASAQGHPGRFGLARSGTLLLDEIGEMPLEMQAKLLRVLQEKVVQRLGGSRAKPFTARVIASTNRDLEVEVAAGRFRLDLLHRLRVVQVELPPLRERGSDVSLLVNDQLRRHSKNLRRAIQMAPHVMAAFEAYSWPGNVRELINMLEGEVSLMPASTNVIDAIPSVIERSVRRATPLAGSCGPMTLESAEREACTLALQKADWNVAEAAQILGVVKATLYSKIRRYGIEQPKTRRGPGRPRTPLVEHD